MFKIQIRQKEEKKEITSLILNAKYLHWESDILWVTFSVMQFQKNIPLSTGFKADLYNYTREASQF